MSQTIITYLSFNGTCADAMRFYEQALGGKIETMLSFADSPMGAPCAETDMNRMAHVCLSLPGGGTLFAGDCPSSMPYEGIKGITLSLNYDTVEQANRIFDALSEGGTVSMGMQPTFWAKSWGMLTDKFGTPWMVNGELLPVG